MSFFKVNFMNWKLHIIFIWHMMKNNTDSILNERATSISKEDMKNPIFVEGMKLAIQDKAQGIKKKVGPMDGSFGRGYSAVMNYKPSGTNNWWDKTNDKLTKWISDVGTTFFTKR
jgi:hypothetical protein